MLSQYFKSSFNFSISKTNFFSQIRKLLLVPVLVFIGLFISTGASADYDIKVEVYDHPEEHANIIFNGQPPETVGDFDQYTIEKFDLKIGSKNHAVSKHSDERLFASIKNLENFDHSLNQWPLSYLVLTYDLSLTQAASEAGKCYRTHFSWRDWFWWTRASYTNCIARVLHAVRFNQTKSIDVTDLLKKKFDDELQLLSRDVDEEKPRLKKSLFDRPLLYFIFPDNYPEEKTGSVLAEAQSRLVFGIATIDYFTRPGLFVEVFDNLTIIKNLINNLEIAGYVSSKIESWYRGYESELFKAFSSVDCENQLSQKIIHNIQPSERLRSRAQDYAEYVCQFNQIKFAELNRSKNQLPREFDDSDIHAENSVYTPYVFCDAYTCQFNISETHKYKLVDDYESVKSIGFHSMEMIFGYLHPNVKWDYREKLCSDTACRFPIDDLDALNEMFDKLKKHIIEEEWRAAGWTLIEIND
jgi:hypothetical protein